MFMNKYICTNAISSPLDALTRRAQNVGLLPPSSLLSSSRLHGNHSERREKEEDEEKFVEVVVGRCRVPCYQPEENEEEEEEKSSSCCLEGPRLRAEAEQSEWNLR
eukprot:755348-Hanusia_phi.AAC.1